MVLMLHNTIAFTEEGVPLLLDMHRWADISTEKGTALSVLQRCGVVLYDYKPRPKIFWFVQGTDASPPNKKLSRMWFQSTCYVTNQKFDGSSLGMQKSLGFGKQADCLNCATSC